MTKIDMWNTPETSEAMGVPANTLAYWRQIGYGPKWAKIGRRVVYRRADVEAWIDEQFAA